MNKTFKLYLIILAILMIIVAIFQASKRQQTDLQFSKKEQIDWEKNFDLKKKSPFGLFIFSQETRQLFKNKLHKTKRSPYQYFSSKEKYTQRNILII